MTAPAEEGKKEISYITEEDAHVVSVTDLEIQICDLYTVGHKPEHKTQPFIHHLDIDTGIGGAIQVWVNFDDGALANTMSITKFNTIKHHLGYCRPSPRWLHMADRSLMKPKARWEGKMEIEGVQVFGSFEVFNSRGNWEFLLGKLLLMALHMVHEYTHDTVTIMNKGLSAVLKNHVNITTEACSKANQKKTIELETRKYNDLKRSREVLPSKGTTEPDDTMVTYVDELQDEGLPTTEIEVNIWKDEDNLFTRLTKPWKKERVEEIIKQVKIGPDLTEEEQGWVCEFISDWADIFTLSVSEVRQVDNAVHCLDIPPEAKFLTKVSQKQLTPPQRKYLYKHIFKSNVSFAKAKTALLFALCER